MSTADERHHIVYNGELYNFLELRRELEGLGHRFRTHSDTEVVLAAYVEWGRDCLPRFRGMFAFAILDEPRQLLFLARDAFGQKPLYYHTRAGRFVFGSELKSLLACADVPRTVSRQNLARYLVYDYVPAPGCILEGVHKLPAGCSMITPLDCGSPPSVERWWRPHTDGPKLTGLSDAEMAAGLLERLRESVRRRLVADVPLGALLSGGIDSSAIVCLMHELGVPRIETFSLGFSDPTFDESSYAAEVAKRFGTVHHERVLETGELLQALPALTDHADEPLADSSFLPTYLVCQLARSRVTVVLGGDGGDELMLGYDTFVAHRLARLLWLPESLALGAAAATEVLLPRSEANMSLQFKLRRFLLGLGRRGGLRDQLWMGSMHRRQLLSLFGSADRGLLDWPRLYEPTLRHEADTSAAAGMDRLGHLYQRLYLQDNILTKVDRASMAVSLEARSPFLDVDFAEYANSLPWHAKYRWGRTKNLLRLAFADRLPASVLGRKKKGFGAPVATWLRTDLRELVQDMLGESRLAAQGLFEPTAVTRLVERHLSRRADHRKELWALLMFQLWHDRWMRA